MSFFDRESFQESYKRATLSTMRAIAADENLEADFSDKNKRGCLPLPTADIQEIRRARGRADLYALRHRYSDAGRQAEWDRNPTVTKIIRNSEEARLYSIGVQKMAGVGRNLDTMLENDCKNLSTDLREPADSLAVAIPLLIRERLNPNRQLPPSAQGLLWDWRDPIEAKAGSLLDSLADNLYEQEAFADLCLKIAQALGLDSDRSIELESDTDSSEDSSPDSASDQQAEEDFEAEQSDSADGELDESEQGLDSRHALQDDSANEEASEAGESGGLDKRGMIRDSPHYRIYTRKFDEEVRAEDLHDLHEIRKLYKQLSEGLKKLSQGTGRLANRLQRQLMAKQKRSWLFDQEEGAINPSRLANLVADPQNNLIFKREIETRFRNTLVTLLIDSSGSMRGRSITTAAMCADILGRTLERCAVKVEILGFTTRAWRGGRSREAWMANGKPPRPGRLNDLRHVIYKNADDNWRRAHCHLGLMLREELLKENIDGEALIWAYNRLVQRPEDRKILMVISDGLPVDNSTLLVNASNYLEEHLQYAIDQIEQHSKVELVAIGIGHDVTHHYKRAVTLNHPEQLAGALVHSLAALFDDKPPAKRPAV